MHFLKREIDGNPKLSSEISNVGERTAQNQAKQGLILDINPYWLAFYRMIESGLDPHFFRRGPWPDFWIDDLFEILRFNDWDLPDLSRHFPEVDELFPFFRKRKKAASFQPFVLRIIAKPKVNHEKLEEADSSYDEDRNQLIRVAQESRLLAVVETHSRPSLIARPGSRVKSGSGIAGTLGGYLKDRNSGSVFGVTCGHVLQGATYSRSGLHIGTAIHQALPVTLPQNTACNQYCGSMTELDIALISMNQTAGNKATSIANLVGNGQSVEMNGATTKGTPTYEIGGHVIEHEIAGACWTDLIQFHAPLGGVLPASVRVATTPIPKGGDSGAWLLRNSTEWAGMVVAANSMFGFALASSEIITKSDAQFGTRLSLA